MTIREALLAEMDDLRVGDDTLEKIIADHGLLWAADYNSTEHRRLVDLCLIDVYKKVLAKPDITEGGYSERWDRDSLLKAIKALYGKWNLSDPDVPKLRAIYKA